MFIICDNDGLSIAIGIKPETKYSFHAAEFGFVLWENVPFNIFFIS
jgi:hypothetical protein